MTVSCALWIWTHHSLYYVLCDDEEDAVDYALALANDGSGAVAGVQRADGSYTPLEEWQAYEDEQERQYEAERERWEREQAKPKPPERRIAPPFDARGQTARVEGDVPTWLGRQDEVAPR